MRNFNKLPKRSIRILGIFNMLVIILMLRLYSLAIEQRYATQDGYYEPMTINFNKDNGFSLFDIPLVNSLNSISFPEYAVKSLYPQAHIKFSFNGEKMRCYVWKLKLSKPISDYYISSIEAFQRKNRFRVNYPLPDDCMFYDIPNHSNLILALCNGRYAYLIEIKSLT